MGGNRVGEERERERDAVVMLLALTPSHAWMVQRRSLGKIGQNPSVSKSNRLYVLIFHKFVVHLGHIP